ncbi:HlyD family efflux transporter periplasmic adaptor subunit [Stenotrophomonas sp. RAC2]|uniref:HlyD family secretion protein n=1 Tax=Stenotrophomonas sp. RAC2 TaxID=3064902 RepID=UPI0027246E40|nr:HlyD family efflux transporter periplasmic adaptor subunit [Stenotrophomonas sp. RAC2]MDV9043874.1 efflux RND transporter periplasmic adaptor subunit [Stenotrophomonas sp. RAC2]
MIEKLGQVLPRTGISCIALSWALAVVAALVLVVLLKGRYARTEEVRGYIALGNITRVNVERAGVLQALRVAPGEKVEAGQPLASVTIPELDAVSEHGLSTGTLGLQSLQEVHSSVQHETTQAQALHKLRLRSIDEQTQQVDEELRALSAALEATRARQRLADSARQRYQALAEQRFVTQLELEDAQARQQQLRAEHANMQASILAARQRRTQLLHERKRAEEELSTRLNSLLLRSNDLKERIYAQDRERGYTVFAPVAGTVDMVSSAVGDNLVPGAPLALIRTDVDRRQPMARLSLPQRTAGLVQVGDTVHVRIDAFPYERHGLVPGRVLRLTSGTLSIPGLPDQKDSPAFLADVALDMSPTSVRIRPEWLKDGMDLQGSVRLQEVNLLEWLFLPVLRGWTRNTGDVLLTNEHP